MLRVAAGEQAAQSYVKPCCHSLTALTTIRGRVTGVKCPMNALLLLFTIGCFATTAACSRTGPRQLETGGPTVDVPEFSSAVKLSPAADNRLRSMGEAVKVIAYFDGDPLPGQ